MVSDGKALTLMVTLYLARNQFCLGSCEPTGLFWFSFSMKSPVVTETRGKTT